MKLHTSTETKPNILIVDDKLENLRLLNAILKEAGYNVRQLRSGKMVQAAVLSAPPDLILLDILMPGMDGYEVCTQLKSDTATHDIPVIFISALNQTVDKIKAFSIGGVDYITKPFQEQEVLARIKAHLDLRYAHQQLEAQSQFLQTVIDALDHPFYVINVQNYMVEMANTAAKNASPTTIPCYTLTHNRQKPCDTAKHPCPLQEIVRTKQPVVMEHVHIDAIGCYGNVELHSFPIFDQNGEVVQIIEYTLDITERKRMENATQARLRIAEASPTASSSELLQIALDEIESLTKSTVSFFHTLLEDQETFVNQAWSTNTLKSAICAVGNQNGHFPVSKSGIWADCIRQRQPIIHNDYQALQHCRGTPPGHVALARALLFPIMRGENVVAVIGMGNKPADYDQEDIESVSLLGDFSWEIIERKRAEEKLAFYAEQLEQMVEEKVQQLEEAHAKTVQMDKMAALGQMATGVAHELNQPLAAITFEADYLKLIAQKARTGQQSLESVLSVDEIQQLGEDIFEDVARCRRITDHLRTFGRASLGSATLINLNKAVENSFILSTTRLREHNVNIHLDLSPELPPILADVHKLEQVFLNLVNNAEYALHHIYKDEEKRLTVATYVAGDYVVATVADNGCGIAEADKANIFAPFFTTKPVGEGTGLGLSISYSIVTEFGGEMTFESEENVGTTFRMQFPIAKDSQ